MAGDSFGKLFKITTWGESHGPAMGVVIEGCPPLVALKCKEEKIVLRTESGKETGSQLFTCDEIQKELDRRKPGQTGITTPRKEQDIAWILSGVFEGKTTGAPITIVSWNRDVRSQDYDFLKEIDRPGHAGFAYRAKYGIYDYRGGGRSSYRETWGRVAAGAIAKKILREFYGLEIIAYVLQIGKISANVNSEKVTLKEVESHSTRCPDRVAANKMETLIKEAMKEGDSLGGVVGVVVRNMPVGLGEPVFDKLDADLFKALKSIHATKSVEIGLGGEVAELKGSQHNDPFTTDASGKVKPASNKAGGVLGGISTGENLLLKVAFKPTATIRKEQETVNIKGEKSFLKGAGRHDPCVLPRAIATVEAMVALVLADHALRNFAQCGHLKK
ncbi:MAG: chorismate synthase [Elusimicrobia bacterium RIFCSPLOWO2_02_FULL_39_32]|nr:MAG: chorismate synthase [Elusimicrobia bacterium GWA2_38_7]OGR78210.1 MAG: chorismate synthase [Elusimicrobia bacterium RIFCSPHIGHO2_02_FULL_39_36]OGR92347.1 MAG: chorismate synthase [Elusimicrobia bacterium RIFCSPLOWO2_02_FULL_39_32]OGR98890.1 MAG: chorismate synthase [Elusimicrobia bacterium RIFCSPLOWO2_12_FULL_39_28]